MDNDKLICELENILKMDLVFYCNDSKNKILDVIANEKRNAELIKFIDGEIELARVSIKVFNPSKKNDDYTIAYFKEYKESITNIAILINLKSILTSGFCTQEMFDNIDYTICKIYNLNYNYDDGTYGYGE